MIPDMPPRVFAMTSDAIHNSIRQLTDDGGKAMAVRTYADAVLSVNVAVHFGRHLSKNYICKDSTLMAIQAGWVGLTY